MPTSQVLSNLNINKLTKDQFNDAVRDGIIGATDFSIITDEDFGAVPQFTTLPVASIDNVGQVIQYKGESTGGLEHNYFYECVSDGQTPATYSWEQTNVQPGGQGGTSDYTELSNKPSINSVTLSGNKTSADLGLQSVSNLVTSVSSSSTDSQYPSAKLFYDTCGNIEALINAL